MPIDGDDSHPMRWFHRPEDGNPLIGTQDLKEPHGQGHLMRSDPVHPVLQDKAHRFAEQRDTPRVRGAALKPQGQLVRLIRQL